MRRFTIVNPGGMADVATVAEFADVEQARVRQLAKRQWAKGSKVWVAVACDRATRRLLYDAAAVLEAVEVTRRARWKLEKERPGVP